MTLTEAVADQAFEKTKNERHRTVRQRIKSRKKPVLLNLGIVDLDKHIRIGRLIRGVFTFDFDSGTKFLYYPEFQDIGSLIFWE